METWPLRVKGSWIKAFAQHIWTLNRGGSFCTLPAVTWGLGLWGHASKEQSQYVALSDRQRKLLKELFSAKRMLFKRKMINIFRKKMVFFVFEIWIPFNQGYFESSLVYYTLNWVSVRHDEFKSIYRVYNYIDFIFRRNKTIECTYLLMIYSSHKHQNM